MSLKFGYWAPILSGGYVLSNIPQRTDWSIAAKLLLTKLRTPANPPKKSKACGKNSNHADLVQPNDGFKTGLLGPADLIVERIKLYREIGADVPPKTSGVR
jgi:hypothetical protein